MKKLLYVGLLLAFAAALCWPGVSSRPQSSDPILIGAGDIGDGLNLNLSGGVATAGYTGPFAVPTNALVLGNNVLAVEVHQTSVSSSDLVWDGGIDCDAFVPLLDAPAVGNAGADVLLLNGSGGRA